MSRINHYDPDAASAGGVPWASWRDTDGDVWQIEYGPDRVVLHRGEEVVELPRSSWSRDILVAQYDDEVVVRIETFDRAIGFHVPLQTAKPLMDFLSAGGAMPTPQVAPAYEEEADRPLLWPKVSPLAVYAVICAAVSFIPWIGILPALVSLGLLIQHHQTVRKTRAWSHSRALCTLASVLLVLGVSVSILAIITPRVVSAARHAGGGHGQPVLRMGSEVGSDALAQANVEAGGLLDGSILAQSRFDGVDWGLVAAGLIVVLFSLTIHEAGHAISAWWLGDDLAKRMGRVTLSPMAHIDPIGTVILPILLWSQLGMFFGWAKPVPVMLDHLENRRRAHSLVSLAGPGSNLLIAAVSMMLLMGIGCIVRLTVPSAIITDFGIPFGMCEASGFWLAPVFGPLATVLSLSFSINIILAFFNLIPIPPLDGSWVLEHMFPQSMGRVYEQIRPYGFLIFIGLIFTGMLSFYFAAVHVFFVEPAFQLLARSTGAPFPGVW